MTQITINLHDQPCGNCTVCIGRTIGAKHEQERIIKLLENDMCSCTLADCQVAQAIALIKEKK